MIRLPPKLRPAILLFLTLALIFIACWQLWGASKVPFHPDESTYLFMSSDFNLLLTRPVEMTWQPWKENDTRQRYRELDAPLTRYLLGLACTIAGEDPLPVDWDWSKDWEANRQAGALPDASLLSAGRLGITALLPLSMLLLFLSTRQMGGKLPGLLAALLLGCSGLVLLHTRRAMAEGALTLGICLALWSFLEGDRRPWLAGLGAALAFNAKHSALVLIPVGLLAVCWLPGGFSGRINKIIRNGIIYLVVFTLLTLALNPVWWSSPLAVLRASWLARQELVQRQTSDASSQYLPGISQRAIVLLANLTFAPLAFYDVGNYRQQTQTSEQAYLANPLHRLLRGPAGGGIFLVLVIAGMALGLRDMLHSPPTHRRNLLILYLTSLALIAGLLIWVPLSWQRYVIPIIPPLCVWAAYPLSLVQQEKAQP